MVTIEISKTVKEELDNMNKDVYGYEYDKELYNKLITILFRAYPIMFPSRTVMTPRGR